MITMGFTIASVLRATTEEFSRETIYGGWATLLVLFIIFLICPCKRLLFISSPRSTSVLVSDSICSLNSKLRISELVTDADLQFLLDSLEEKLSENDKWEHVIDKRNSLLSYSAKCCKPKVVVMVKSKSTRVQMHEDGPLKYLSVTTFNHVSPEMLRDFYMDNDYRKQWDRTVVEHEQLHVDKSKGVEVGRTVKKFPLLRPREYVLAWRLWEGADKIFYCFIKECDHSMAPRQRKYVRVEFFKSGWRIRKVPGRNVCEISMFHQEDAGLNTEMAKLAFSRGIWNYVCRMDNALRRYSTINCLPSSSVVTAVNLIQKVPTCLDTVNSNLSPTHAIMRQGHVTTDTESREGMISRRPSRKLLANGLLILGGAICLSRGHSSLGAKVALAYILTKISKRGAKSNKSKQI